MKYSLPAAGLIGAIALPILVSTGFSEARANEVMTVAWSLPGIITAYVTRGRKGDVSLADFKR